MTKIKMWKFGISPDKFIADCVDLIDDEIGKYFRFLCYAWKNEAHLPDDIDRINRIAKNPDLETTKYILERFFEKDKLGYYCPAQLEEWNWAIEKSNKATESINKRWSYDRNTNNNNSNNNNKIKYTPEFDEVWNKLSVKRGNKKNAFIAFNKLNGDDKNKIIEKYNFLISTISDPQYYPHFSSWLNGDRIDEDVHLGEQAIRKLNSLGSDHKYIGFIKNKHTFLYDMGFSKENVYYDKKGKKINE